MASFKLMVGYYFPGESFLHRLNVELKTACFGLLILSANFLHGFPAVSVLIAAGLVLFLLSRIPPVFIFHSLKPFLWLFLLTFLLQMFTSVPDGRIILRVGPMYLSKPGVTRALLISGRFLVIILFSALLISTTSPQSLVRVIVKWLSPMRHLKIPVEEIGLMMMIALRFLPILQDEAMRIMEARKIRLSVLGNEGKKGLSDFQELLFAILVSVLRRSQELSLSMTCRGYGSRALKKSPSDLQGVNMVDIWFLVLTIVGVFFLLFTDGH